MNDLKVDTVNEVSAIELTLENRLEIIGEGLRKKYLSRLTEMEIAKSENDILPLEDDLIDNIRLYHITEMVYERGGEPVTDKFTTVFNTLSDDSCQSGTTFL